MNNIYYFFLKCVSSVYDNPDKENSIPNESDFSSVAKGIGTSITFEEDGKTVEPFDNSESDNIIELNGIKSELVISR